MYIKQSDIFSLKDYAEHLKALPEKDKYSRFGFKINDFSIDQLMLRIAYEPDNHVLWRATDSDDTYVGWGHMAKDGNSWELAVSVDHAHQGKGIGSKLIKDMLEWAKYKNIDEVYMHCIEDNKVIQHLAQKHGLKTRERGGGERTAAIEIPEPNLFEVNTQLWKEHSAIMSEYADLRRRLNNLWFGRFTQ